MIIKSIRLHNIRSYEDCEIEFPEGSILLSGDIGAGKSSILLALEFALFGLKTELPSNALLRKGKTEGYVQVKLEIEDKEVIIRRTLKSNQKRISQGSGYLIRDGIKEELSTEELKSKVLKLLGYPEELQKKKKSLIYRFTVYVPQGRMKQILFESREDRLNTLRKLFGIDKYKRIKNNTSLLLTNLRVRIREERTRSEKIDEIEKEIRELNIKKRNLNFVIKDVEEKLSKISLKEKVKEKEIEAIKKENELLEELNRERSVVETELKEKEKYTRETEQNIKILKENKISLSQKKPEITENKEELNNKTKELESEVNDLHKNIAVLETERSELIRRKRELTNDINELYKVNGLLDSLNEELKKLKLELNEKENKVKKRETLEAGLKSLNQSILELKGELANTERTVRTVSSSKRCPVCLQDISDDYKEKIVSDYLESERQNMHQILDEYVRFCLQMGV